MARPSTYSIVSCDLERGEWGVAVQSKFLAVGSVVPWASPELGVTATHAHAHPSYRPYWPVQQRGRGSADVARLLLSFPLC